MNKVIKPFMIQHINEQGEEELCPVFIRIREDSNCVLHIDGAIILSEQDSMYILGQIHLNWQEEGFFAYESEQIIYNEGFNQDIMQRFFHIWDLYHLSTKVLPAEVRSFLENLPETKEVPEIHANYIF